MCSSDLAGEHLGQVELIFASARDRNADMRERWVHAVEPMGGALHQSAMQGSRIAIDRDIFAELVQVRERQLETGAGAQAVQVRVMGDRPTHGHFAGVLTSEPIEVGVLAEGTEVRLGARFVQQYAYLDRKSTRLNSSHVVTSYPFSCLKKKNYNNCKCKELK